MSHICHPIKIEFAVLLIGQRYYILWSIPFREVNPKVKLTYISLGF